MPLVGLLLSDYVRPGSDVSSMRKVGVYRSK